MELAVVTLACLTIVAFSYMMLDKLLLVGYRMYIKFKFTQDVRLEQSKEVDRLLNGE